ncbi:hypothetical protein ACFQRB_15550 [Halobaculum litoreum]|uniref:Uncharacterized protein n=1 Tax=Halobaculum litoreum TaxID=3031998 RepID=A0ABD5XS97_9EURY
MSVRTFSVGRFDVSARELQVAALVVNLELLAVLAYFALTNARLSSPLFTLYGLTWVNLALVVFARYRPPAADAQTRRRAAAVAGGYALLLSVFGGGRRRAARHGAGGDGGDAPAGVGAGGRRERGRRRGGPHAREAARLRGAGVPAVRDGRRRDERGGRRAARAVLLCLLLAADPRRRGDRGRRRRGFVVAAVGGIGYGPSTLVFCVTVALLWWRPGFDLLR